MAAEHAEESDHGQPTLGDWSAGQLGGTLRAIRSARGLRLSDLARDSGLSTGFLSQVEQGKTDISVGRLIRIAQALHVPLTDLVRLPRPTSRPLARAGERISIPNPTEGMRVELLASSLADGHTYALSTLGPRVTAEARSYRIPGQAYFVFIVSGHAVIEFGSGAPVTLERGDSISFMSEEFRRMTNLGDDPCQLVWISVPAT